MQDNKELFEYPIFSLVIPVYNVSKYIRECIDSILNQSYKDFEIILIDDGSTDDSGEICQFYSDNHNEIKFFSQSNKGTASARNVGIQNSKGKFVWFVDSDDLIKDDSLEILFKIIKKHQEYDIISFKKLVFFGHKSDIIFNDCEVKYIFFNNSEDYLSYFQIFPASTCLNIFRLDFIRNNNLCFQEDTYYEDEMFNLNLYLNFSPKILVTNHQLYFYRTGMPNSKTFLLNNEIIVKKLISKIELLKEIGKIKENVFNALTLQNKKKYYKELILHFLEIYFLMGKNQEYKFLRKEIKTNIKHIPLGKKILKKSTLKKIVFNINFDLFSGFIILQRKLNRIYSKFK